LRGKYNLLLWLPRNSIKKQMGEKMMMRTKPLGDLIGTGCGMLLAYVAIRGLFVVLPLAMLWLA
jgi:hypothetical protein